MEVLIEEYKIDRKVKALAHKITEEHRSSGNMLPPVMICVLKGSFMFFTDLVKDMGVDCEIDFIRAKSNKDSIGVSITLDLEIDLKGKRVYVVDDMVDTGQTMFEVLCRVNDSMPTEVKIVTLVHRKGNEFPVDHFCFEIGNECVVGYGFDEMGLKRNYRNIYKK